MILSIERIKDMNGTNIRFMRKVMPWNVQNFMDFAYSIEGFILTFANSIQPSNVINATLLKELDSDPEEIASLHEELRHNLDVLFVPSYMKFYKYVDGEYVPEANDINYKANQCTLVAQCRQTFLETAFSYVLPENGQGEIFTERTLVKFNTVSEIFPLIFTRFIASVLDGGAKGVNKCPVCGKYFIPVKGKEHRFCSDECRISTYENPYYKKYRNRDLYIGRNLDTWAFQKPGDRCEAKLEKLKTQHKIWQNCVRTILPTAEQVYGSPDEFGKAISAEWKRLKKEVC